MASRTSRGGRRGRDRATPGVAFSGGSVTVPAARLFTTAAAAAVAATLTRLWLSHAWDETAVPASAFYVGDARAFLAYASHLVAGRTFDNGVPFHPPGWPFALSLLFRLLDYAPLADRPVDPAVVKAFVACLSGASVGLATWLAGRLSGAGVMYVVALLGTFHFGHMVTGSVPNAEALYGLLMLATLALATGWLAGDGRGRASVLLALATGVTAGFTALVRPEFVLAAIVLGLGCWRLTHSRPAARRALVGYAIGFGLALVPSTAAHWWSLTAFNASRAARLPGPLPRFAPVTSYGAFNFAMANHANADGGPNSDHPLLTEVPVGSLLDEGQLDLAQPAIHELYVHGYAIGLRWMAAHPRDAVALAFRKLAMMSGAFALGYLQSDWPAGVDGVRRRVDLLDPASRALWWPHLALTLGGAWLLRRRRLARWLLAAPALTLVASTVLFFGYVRLGVAYLPVFWIAQGVALTAVATRIVPVSSPLRRHAAALVLTAGLCLLVVEAAGASRARAVVLDGPRTPDGALIGDETLQVRRVR